VDIIRTRPRFDGKFLHWLSMRNFRLFQLSMRMDIRMYISLPYLHPSLNY